MPSRCWAGVVAALVALHPAGAQSAQRPVLVGSVTDSVGQLVPFANVQLNGGDRVAADDSGRFRIQVPPGHFTIDVRRIGYEPLHFDYAAPPNAPVWYVMRPIAHTISPIVVNAPINTALSMHGFYDRMHESQRAGLHGYFVTPEDIERRQPRVPSDMILDVPTVGRKTIGLSPPKFVIQGINGCTANLFLNGVRQNPIIVKRGQPDTTSIDDFIDGTQVAGIEVYPRAADAPARYSVNTTTCAVVLVWTR